ncbi:MAG: leucyl aminopeptidase family protein, partial [Bacteroidales bacterium]|nr:leucyl aminopeptidase family protein [Bacteroidales bacterium]
MNMATLTGSAQRAIGRQGMVGMHQKAEMPFNSLLQSGYKVHERIAPFPFWDEYDEELKSDIADVKNMGGSNAGAITAGKFLARFTDYPFIHLDIAGVAFNEKKNSYQGVGGSGIGTRLFVDFLSGISSQ